MYKALLFGLLAAMPSSSNFTLNAYDFGNGGGSPGSSSYNLQASVGAEGGNLGSGSFALPAGIRASTTVATPPAPTLANPDSSYNRLHLTLAAAGLPSDYKYAIAISDDDFVSIFYVQPDQTIGSGFGISSYQTYAAWGGAGGFWILGLEPETAYKVRVAALQGAGTGSSVGPVASAATAAPSLTFGVSTSLSASPPFAVNFSSLPPGQVTAADATITAQLTTNAQSGGQLLLRSQNGGLTSSLYSYTIASATADLAVANRGYGARVSASSQDSGGPLAATSPYNGAGDTVGGLTAAWQQLAGFASPIVNGSLSLSLKAKSDTTVPAAPDYADALTLSIAPMF